MTRLYLKIFFSFWLITIMMIVGTSLVVHWFDLGTNKHLNKKYQAERKLEPAKRLMRDVVREAINHTKKDVTYGLAAAPEWATSHLFIIDDNSRDLLDRPLSADILAFLPSLTPNAPYAERPIAEQVFFGRHITLEDGNVVRVVTSTTPDGHNVFWQLFFNNVWPTLLVSILISGTACFFLAKRMSRGLTTLRTATQKIAGGDLSVRVTPQFQGRRDEIGMLGQEFDNMTERLEKAMLEQKRMIKDVSHELRSPLARLQVALALAQKRSNGDVDQELNRIKQAAEYLNDVISDILSLPLNENESWELNDTLDLVSLLETLTESYREEAQSKEVALSLITDEHDALVPTHGNTLIGVFENIVRNAIHYTSPRTPIAVKVDQLENSHFRVRISDRGPGVPEECLADIFQPFFRTDEARDRSSGGYGLGLAIAKRTVALHGGTMEAINNPEGGLTISVMLPKCDLE
ncbi:HAMP domain-containing protein [Exilibacterium tricleocarpae]|uniref:histidine kinase n=1 Tax=Exilibacterium tricleocarpae TaxID=2591008 RepID=A0A545TLZ0_9GAMM|nr:ATP-binding protein [Exilibacterium tricleocarpae]TQV78265.1 HAMP domain-containing protein [Exilibacterium tricleocarpae]